MGLLLSLLKLTHLMFRLFIRIVSSIFNQRLDRRWPWQKWWWLVGWWSWCRLDRWWTRESSVSTRCGSVPFF